MKFGLELKNEQVEKLKEISIYPKKEMINKLDYAMNSFEGKTEINEKGFSFELSIDIDEDFNVVFNKQNDHYNKNEQEFICDNHLEKCQVNFESDIKLYNYNDRMLAA